MILILRSRNAVQIRPKAQQPFFRKQQRRRISIWSHPWHPGSYIASRRFATNQPNTTGQPPLPDQVPDPNEQEGKKSGSSGERRKQTGSAEPNEEQNGDRHRFKHTAFRMFEAAATTAASIAVLGAAGYAYHRYYKTLVLKKIQRAFEPGDPVLELAALDRTAPTNVMRGGEEHWFNRDEQAKIDAIIAGKDVGHYHLFLGEKGCGKSSMILNAMQQVDGEGISMFEAHADLEIFRMRLGKCLDFEFHEDYIGSLFSIKGPREASALLDIDRAFAKLEKIAIKRRREVGRPLVLIINSAHLIRNDEDGVDLLELIQQRAEQWAATNLVTVVFNSDEYFILDRLKKLGTRLIITPIHDLRKDKAIEALRTYRGRWSNTCPDSEILLQVYDKVGGRLNFLSRVAKAPNMLAECELINRRERTWFLNKCGILGSEMDDDVMDQQKFCSAAMVLAKALVDAEQAHKPPPQHTEEPDDPQGQYVLPSFPIWEARQIMTRADFLEQYEHLHIFAVDSDGNVRADSVPMMNAFREVCGEPGFDEHLEATLQRISDIESLGRTRELVAKDLVQGRQYKLRKDRNGTTSVELEQQRK